MKDLFAFRQTSDLLFTSIMLLCAVLIPVWLFRIRTKGLSAYFMASAFATLGLLTYATQQEASAPIRYTLGGLLFVLLIGDFVARAARQSRDEYAKKKDQT